MNTKRNGYLPSNTSLLNDFLAKDLFDWSTTEGNTIVPRVNISENDEGFRVELAAPGMKKEDFQVELDNDMLTVSSQVSNNQETEREGHIRKEFSYQSFQRSFHLPNTIEGDKIDAKYQDGILILMIPKKEEAKKKPVKLISIN